MLKLLSLFLGIVVSISMFKVIHGESQVPCYFIFGDSLSDAGNNNNLKTKAISNYLPYGIDFLVDGRPSGRFTNGLTIVDVIATGLLKKVIAPYNITNNQQITRGVNYASGSAGIRPETGEHLGDRISLDKQIQNHISLISKLGSLINGSVPQHLQSCLYTINIGSNDYINNYFMRDHYQLSWTYNPTQFVDNLITQYSRHIKTLYNNGARKVAIFGLGKVGCTLAEIARLRPTTICVDAINNNVTMFNTNLKTLVQNLNEELPGSKFIFIDMQAIEVGPQQGITVLDKPCCTLREDFQCKENESPCTDRNTYLFWDGFHPTSAVNKITGAAVLQSLTAIL